MTSKFDNEAQRDLMAAAAHLYEAEMYDQCMVILNILMGLSNRDAYTLAGHCISDQNPKHGDAISKAYYDVSCDLGSAVGCFNSYRVRLETDKLTADFYMGRAVELGWNG